MNLDGPRLLISDVPVLLIFVCGFWRAHVRMGTHRGGAAGIPVDSPTISFDFPVSTKRMTIRNVLFTVFLQPASNASAKKKAASDCLKRLSFADRTEALRRALSHLHVASANGRALISCSQIRQAAQDRK
ncbi:hypothetical protein QCE48_04035 [Caballeronia sp. LZ024]|nr:hypothetical protein [Caballeronia sp. LZ024]